MDESQVVYGGDGFVGPGSVGFQNSEMAEKICDSRAEIDTSAPFDSVKEAVSRFGGVGYWKPSNKPLQNQQDESEEISITKLEEQASELEKDVILKQRETLNILQQLETTRAFVEDLKMEMKKEEEDKENNGYHRPEGGRRLKFSEGLKQAQQNLSKTTNGILEIRASMELFNKKLERERLSLEKTKERLKQNCVKMSSVEERQRDSNMEEHGTEMILKELRILNSEAEKFRLAAAEKMKEVVALKQVLKNMEEVAEEKWGWEHGKKMEYCPVVKPTLSIGQILSRKLFLQEEFMPEMMPEKGFLKRKVSLAQMLGKQNGDMPKGWDSDKKYSNRKRKESGFAARFPFLAKQNNNQKRKKPTPNLK